MYSDLTKYIPEFNQNLHNINIEVKACYTYREREKNNQNSNITEKIQ